MVKKSKAMRSSRRPDCKALDQATKPFGEDDIDKFHQSNDKLALNPAQDSDSGEDILGSEEEGVLDIDDPSDEEADSEDDFEDGDLEGDKKLAARKPCQAPTSTAWHPFALPLKTWCRHTVAACTTALISTSL